MFSLPLYFQILGRIICIVLVAILGLSGIITGRAIILGIFSLFIALLLIANLTRFLNTSNRRIQLFLNAIADDESMLFFPEKTGSEEQRQLHKAFNRISLMLAEHKRKEFDRELQQKEYESWEKLMRVLTHEIMNSIAPIVSLSGTLLSYYESKGTPKSLASLTEQTILKTIRGLKTVKSQGQNLMGFTDSYRRMSRLQAPNLKTFPLDSLLENLHLLLQTDLSRLSISLEITTHPSPILLVADEELFSQVLLNLLKNAMQALEEQPEDRRIRIHSEQTSHGIEISVIDNGPGIAAELLEDIFVPFFTTKTTGSGIGLSLSRQIIRMHGGELHVLSTPFSETKFTVKLPLERKSFL